MTSITEQDRTAPRREAHTEEQAASIRVHELALGLCNSAMMMVATKLGVADQIDDKPMALTDLADAVGADAATLGRLLRALEVRGVFQEVGEDHFAHTDMSRLLREDHPKSMRWLVRWLVEPWTWMAWPQLDQSVRTGQPVFPGQDGKDFFTYLAEDAPESYTIFNRAMSQRSGYTSETIADIVDLSGATRIVDIGGGQGHLLCTLLRRNPHVHGILYDLPAAVDQADAALRPGGELADRATVRPGSCLESVPAGCDVYILKNLLEWEDDKTVHTLHNVAITAPTGARVVIIQPLIDDSPEIAVTTAMDMMLLINVGGRRHRRRHLEDLIAQSGLELDEIRPTQTNVTILYARVPNQAR
ncbi:MAG: methyltransferase [Pseudonocardiaceae bacterium]